MNPQEESLKYKTKKGLYWKFSEQFASYVTQFVVGVIMARLLSPHDFGTAAIPAVFLNIAEVFIEGSFGLALIRKPEISEKDLSTSFYYGIVVGVCCYLLLYVGAPLIANYYNESLLKPLVRITALTFLLNPLLTPQNVLLNRRLDFKTPAKISVLVHIVSGAAGITVAYLGFGIWALVISSLCTSVLTFLFTWIVVRWFPKTSFSRESFKYLWSYGNKMMISQLVNAVYHNIVTLIIGKSYGTKELGYYNRAKGFASIPSSNLGSVINTVSFPVLSKVQSDNVLLSRNYRRMIRVSSFLVFPLMTLLCALARPLIITLVTEKWIECVVLLQIMCFTYMFIPAQLLNLNLLQVKGRTDLSLKLELIKKSLFTVAVLFAIRFGLIVLCLVDLLMNLIALILNSHYTGIFLEVGIIRQIKDMLPHFILSIIMMVLVYFLVQCFSIAWLQLLFGGIGGLVFYFGIAYLLKFEELNDVKYMLARNKS